MTIEITAPVFPESIPEGEISKWYKEEGDSVKRDELLADVETEKTTLEIPAPVSGKLVKIMKGEGSVVEGSEVIALFEASDGSRASAWLANAPQPKEKVEQPTSVGLVAPSARKLAQEKGLDLSTIKGSGRNGMITKQDVVRMLSVPDEPASETPKSQPDTSPAPVSPSDRVEESEERVQRRVPMTRLRATIANRLVEAQRNAAMLTTFNEADMSPIIKMRKQYQEAFQATHNGTRLGFMSFFVRACVEALKRFPLVNASIDGTDIVYHGYYDIGVAVSTEKGLVVPVVRDADALGLAQIEDKISEYGSKAREGKLAIEDMQGGTFTISNGGVFGSLMSTPILNPPQTAILGMHKIQERPVVEDGNMVIRPMMYLALSYDHRLIDGSEAVRFLVAVKGMIEDPARILLEL